MKTTEARKRATQNYLCKKTKEGWLSFILHRRPNHSVKSYTIVELEII